MDALYLTGPLFQWTGYNELRYSIRSLVKHYSNLDNIYVVGYKPGWLKNVTFIPMKDIYMKQPAAYTRDGKGRHVPGNIISKVIRGCLSDISDDFILMADDYFIIKDVDDTILRKVPTHGDYSNFKKYKKGNNFSMVLKNTIRWLKENGYSCYNCESHCPYVLNKLEYPQIMIQVPYVERHGFVLTTIYFNVLGNNNYVHAGKMVKYLRAGRPKEEIYEGLSTRYYMNVSGKGRLNLSMKKMIIGMFPEKTKYEI